MGRARLNQERLARQQRMNENTGEAVELIKPQEQIGAQQMIEAKGRPDKKHKRPLEKDAKHGRDTKRDNKRRSNDSDGEDDELRPPPEDSDEEVI